MSTTTKVTIKGKDYEIGFPKTGEFFNIQTLKANLTQGKYDVFKMLERDGLIATVLIDAISTFNVMLPQLKKELNVESMLDLELENMIEIGYAFKDQYTPWYESKMELISKPKTEAAKETVA